LDPPPANDDAHSSMILATQKGPPHTTADTVIIRRGIQGHLAITHSGHDKPPCLSSTQH